MSAWALWSCSHCGAHPESRGNWCAAGCGRDYNQMERLEGDAACVSCGGPLVCGRSWCVPCDGSGWCHDCAARLLREATT